LFEFRSAEDDSVAMFVIDSIVDVLYCIDILFNFHTSFVTDDGEVITDDVKIRRYLASFNVDF
jgi:hypothetical protein